MTTAPPATTAEQSSAPARGGMVLLALILVAAVANLNLAVANVALPSIGAAFDASQTSLDLIAVGYSLGLAASVLYFGALGDRYGRKLMLLLGTALADPVQRARRLGAQRAGAVRGPRRRRPLGRHGLPDHARPDHRAVVGPRPHAVDRPVVRHRGGHRRARAAAVRAPARALLVGLGLPAHAAARRRRAACWRSSSCPRHVNEGTEPVDNLGGVLSVLLVGALVLAINFAPCRTRATLIAIVARHRRRRRAVAFVLRQRRAANPLYDLRRRRAPDLLGRGRARASSCSAR